MYLLYFIALIGYAMLLKHLFPNMQTGNSLVGSSLLMLSTSYFTVIILGSYVLFPYVIIWGGFLTCISLIVYSLIKKKNTCIDCSLILWIIVCLTLCTLLREGIFISHDNYSFWGRAVRELYLFEDFYINANSNMAHTDYNPIIASLQYCVVKVTGWRNASLFYVIISIVSSIIVSLSQLITKRKKNLGLQILFIGMCLILLPTIHSTFATSFLGADSMLALFPLWGTVIYYQQQDDLHGTRFLLILLAFVLPAIKLYSGMLFLLCIVASIVIHSFRTQKENAKWWALPTLMLFFAMFMQLSWSYKYNYHTELQYAQRTAEQNAWLNHTVSAETADIPFSFSYFIKGNPRNEEIKEVITHDSLSESGSVIKKGIQSILCSPIYSSQLTESAVVLLIFLLFWALCLHNKTITQRHMEYGTLLIAGSIYFVGILITYLVQPATLTGTTRYFGVVVIIWLFYVLLLLFEESATNDKVKLLLILVVALFVSNTNMYNSIHAYVASDAQEPVVAQDMKSNLNDIIIPLSGVKAEDRILIIDAMNWGTWSNNGLNSFAKYYYQYEFLPARATILSSYRADYSNLDQLQIEEINAAVSSSRSDYVLINCNDANYAMKYYSMFDVPGNATMPWLFKVNVSSGNISYEYIPTTNTAD